MKTLLDTSSPKYLRRLVRELNAVGSIDGFYAQLPRHTYRDRCNRARLNGGELEVRSTSLGRYFKPDNHAFTDAYGRDIVASRG